MRIGSGVKNGVLIAAIATIGITTELAASPKIEVDTPDVNVGLLQEGKQKLAEHVFKVKNTGDSVLVIKQVRPG
jgi:hypothetical protein